jgi:hypothetical protein
MILSGADSLPESGYFLFVPTGAALYGGGAGFLGNGYRCGFVTAAA